MSKIVAVDWQRLNNWRQSPPDSKVGEGSSALGAAMNSISSLWLETRF
ncbi:hypothetical protein [Nostoc sp. C052]|nr:hypothetical protein [Nostoc sp. C052]